MLNKPGKGQYEVSCDYCSTGYAEIEADIWEEAKGQLRSDGWSIKKMHSKWRYKCPDCVDS